MRWLAEAWKAFWNGLGPRPATTLAIAPPHCQQGEAEMAAIANWNAAVIAATERKDVLISPYWGIA